MSIINDALKRAEQHRKYTIPEPPKHFNSQTSTNAAVLDQPPPPKVESEFVAPRVRIAVQAPPPIPYAAVFKPQPESKAAPAKFILLVSLVGFSVLIAAALFLFLPRFFDNNQTVVSQPIVESVPAVTQPATVVRELPVVRVEQATPVVTQPVIAPATPIHKRERKTQHPLKSKYQLTGIYGIGGQDRYAFINGKIVQPGGTINDATVVSIEQNTVTLKQGSRVFTLTMP